jgi:hypothetical protein
MNKLTILIILLLIFLFISNSKLFEGWTQYTVYSPWGYMRTGSNPITFKQKFIRKPYNDGFWHYVSYPSPHFENGIQGL